MNPELQRPTRYCAAKIFMLLALLMMIGCSGYKPVLYPNDHLKNVGQDQADKDIAECREMADHHVTSSGSEKQVASSTVFGAGVGAAGGAVGGAVRGRAKTGAAIGAASGATAGFLRGLFRQRKPNSAYMNHINRCLQERGYEPVGWE